MNLKEGRNTTEFWLLAAVGLAVLYFTASGKLNTGLIISSAETIDKAAESVPVLIGSIERLISSLGPLFALIGVIYSYINKRTNLKEKELELTDLKVSELLKTYQELSKKINKKP